MAKLKKIEDRTNWFIAAYKKLDDESRLPSNVELAEIMGMPSKSTVSNILKKQQNIQPDQWEKFKDHFGIAEAVPSSNNSEREPSMKELLAGLTEGFRAIAATMQSMENKMAREVSLNKVIEGQAGGIALVVELLTRDVRREANGNPEKEKEIRAEIAHRIGPKLNADLQADMSADGGR